MKQRFYVRIGPPVPEGERWLEDYPTFFLLGRWLNAWNSRSHEWFMVTEVPDDPNLLVEAGGHIRELKKDEWLRNVGPWGRVVIFEDRVGVRVLSVIRRRFARSEKGSPPLRPAVLRPIEYRSQNGTDRAP